MLYICNKRERGRERNKGGGAKITTPLPRKIKQKKEPLSPVQRSIITMDVQTTHDGADRRSLALPIRGDGRDPYPGYARLPQRNRKPNYFLWITLNRTMPSMPPFLLPPPLHWVCQTVQKTVCPSSYVPAPPSDSKPLFGKMLLAVPVAKRA